MTTSEVVAGILSLSSTPRETGGPPGLRITGESGSDEEECQHDQGGNPREYFGEGPLTTPTTCTYLLYASAAVSKFPRDDTSQYSLEKRTQNSNNYNTYTQGIPLKTTK